MRSFSFGKARCAAFALAAALSVPVLFAAVPSAVPVQAADSFLVAQTQAAVYEGGPIDLPYRIYLPEGYDGEGSYRLVLFLHGAGERGDDNLAPVNANYGFAESIVRSGKYREDTILLIPQCPAGMQWVDLPWTTGAYTMPRRMSTALEAAKGLLDETVNTYAVDASCVYACGVSMGGMGVWDLLARYPGYFAAAAAICGCLDESKAELYAQTPVFTAHDPGDTVVGAQPTARMAAALGEMGAEIVYKTYDIGARDSTRHSSWIDVFADTSSADNVYDFLFSHTRQTYTVRWTDGDEVVLSRSYAAGMMAEAPEAEGITAWKIGEEQILPGEWFEMPASDVTAEAVRGDHTGLIVGCCVGGAAVLAGGIAAAVLVRKKKKNKSA